jgi:hypothetical protein
MVRVDAATMAASKRRDLADLPACQTDGTGTVFLVCQRPGERVKLSS